MLCGHAGSHLYAPLVSRYRSILNSHDGFDMIDDRGNIVVLAPNDLRRTVQHGFDIMLDDHNIIVVLANDYD
jgi:hypothetical protein